MDSPDFDLLEQYLLKLGCNVIELADDKGFTLLHHAVLKGQAGKVEQVIELANKLNSPSKKQIRDWVNSRTTKD